MPEFVDVASHFDQEPVADGYTGAYLFKAQFNTFDESSPDGSVVKRRTMSVRPGTALPPRKVVSIMDGEIWIVGDGNSDSFFGTRVRSAYWMKKATDLVNAKTPAEAVTGSPGSRMFIHKEYLKDTVNTMTNSEYDTQWDISMYPGEPIVKGNFIVLNDDGAAPTFLRVRTTHADLNGLRVATCDELDAGAFVTVNFDDERVFDPVLDKYTGTPVSAPGIMLDMYKLYNVRTDMDPRQHGGDKTLLIEDAWGVAVGQHLEIAGQPWSVIAKERELDAWNLHIRQQ